MTLQVVASPMIIILTIIEVSFTLLENIFSTGVTHDDHHMRIVVCVQATYYLAAASMVTQAESLITLVPGRWVSSRLRWRR